MTIKLSKNVDVTAILEVHTKAFGPQKGEEIAQLVDELLHDATASPITSLAAFNEGAIVGHILFTKVKIAGNRELPAQILAPLAVLPEFHNKGIGTKLIQAGLKELKNADIKLVFVLGHPGYYPRCGFTPAGQHGFEAPYPIPEEHAGAWMVQALTAGIIGVEKGKVQCSDVLNDPKHWQE